MSNAGRWRDSRMSRNPERIPSELSPRIPFREPDGSSSDPQVQSWSTQSYPTQNLPETPI